MRLRGLTLAILVGLFLVVAFTLSGTARTQAAQVVTSRQCSAAAATTAGSHHAGLVVTFGDRTTKMFCVAFTEDSITGLQLLERSGLPVITSTSGLGAAVCSIDGKGSNDPTNCFSSCTGSTCAYWAYYQFAGNAWTFSSVGASQHMVTDGDIDGWAWGPGGVSSGSIPAQPGVICPPPTPTPQPTPTPAAIASPPPAPQPTWTPSTPPAGNAAPQDATGAAAATPVETMQSNVEGAAVWPTAPPASPTATVSATATPLTGVVDVGAAQGKQNESAAQAAGSRGGGNLASLVVFGVVAAVLLAGGGVVMYRRRRVG